MNNVLKHCIRPFPGWMGRPGIRAWALPLAITQIVALIILGTASWMFWMKQYQLPACEMTYVRSLFQEVSSPLLQTCTGYKLYKYRDMSHDPGPKAGDIIYPGLFVPGNAGKYIQIRPLASETSRYWSRLAANRTKAAGEGVRPVYIQWYSVDTKEELCAFDGDLLERQVRFVVSSLRYLQHQYRLGIYSDGSSGEASESKKRFSCRYEEIRYGGSVPSRCADTHPGLVLLGHSFGGVIARAAMVAAAQQGDVGPHTVSLLLTTSSPHQRPPIPSHPSLQRFYHRHAAAAAAAGERATLNSPSPAAGQEGAPSLQHTGRTDGLGHFMPPVVSINSDYNDTQVGTLLTSLSGLHPRGLGLHISTLGIPGTWASVQHVCLNWCNQLLQPLSRVLVGAASEALHTHRQQVEALQQQAEQQLEQQEQEGQQGQGQQDQQQHDRKQGQQQERQEQGRERGDAGEANVFLRYALQRLQGRALAGESLVAEPVCSGPALEALRDQHGGMRAGEEVQNGTIRLVGRAGASKLFDPAKRMGSLLTWRVPSTSADSVAGSNDGDACTGCSSGCSCSSHGHGRVVFSVLSSGLKPCTGLRVWVSYHAAAKQKGGLVGGGSGHGSAGALPAQQLMTAHQDVTAYRDAEAQGGGVSGRVEQQLEVVEVTHQAAWLPAIVPAGRRAVRDWGKMREVMAGLDFNATSGWAWLLPPFLMAGAAEITLWTGAPANADAFFLAAQLWPEEPSLPVATLGKQLHSDHQSSQQQHTPATPPHLGHQSSQKQQQQQQQQQHRGTQPVHIGWQSLLRSQQRHQGGPIALPVSIHLLPPVVIPMDQSGAASGRQLLYARTKSYADRALYLSGLSSAVSLSVRQTAGPDTLDTSGTCSHPVLILPDHTQGGANWGSWQERGSSMDARAPSFLAAANLTTFSLAPCLDHPGAQGACRATLLLDPACAYSLSLRLDLGSRLPTVVLSHAHALWAMVQVLLLLAMARQLHALRECSTSACSPSAGHQYEVYQQDLRKGQQHNPACQSSNQPLLALSYSGSSPATLPTLPRVLSSVWGSLFQTAADPCVLALAAVTAAAGLSHSSGDMGSTAQPADAPSALHSHLGAATWLAALPLIPLCCSAAKQAAKLGTKAVASQVSGARQSQQQLQQQPYIHSWPGWWLKPSLHPMLLAAAVAVLAACLQWSAATSMGGVFGNMAAAWEVCLSVLARSLSSSPWQGTVSNQGSAIDSTCQMLQAGGFHLPQLSQSCSSTSTSNSSSSSSIGGGSAASAPPQESSSASASPPLGLLPLLPLDALLTFPVLATTLLLLTHALLGLLGATLRISSTCLNLLLQCLWRGAGAGILAVSAQLRRLRNREVARGECKKEAKGAGGSGGGRVIAVSCSSGQGHLACSNEAPSSGLPLGSFGLGSSPALTSHQLTICTPSSGSLVFSAVCLAVTATSILHLSLGLTLATVLVLVPAYLLSPSSSTPLEPSAAGAASPPPQFPLPGGDPPPFPKLPSAQHQAPNEPVVLQQTPLPQPAPSSPRPHIQPAPSTQRPLIQTAPSTQPASAQCPDPPFQPALPLQVRCSGPASHNIGRSVQCSRRAWRRSQGIHALLQSAWLFMLAGCVTTGPSGLSALASFLERDPAFELTRAAGQLAPSGIRISAGARGSAANRQTCPLDAEATASTMLALQAAAAFFMSAAAVGAAAAVQALFGAKGVRRHLAAASAVAALSGLACIQTHGGFYQQLAQSIGAFDSRWLSLAAYMLAVAAAAKALPLACAQMWVRKSRLWTGHSLGQHALFMSAVLICTAAAAAAAAAHCLPLVVEHMQGLLPLLLQGKGGGEVFWEAEAGSAQHPGALGWWYVWGADVALLLPACLGPLILAAVWWGFCCLDGSQHLLQHLDMGEGQLANCSGAASVTCDADCKPQVQGRVEDGKVGVFLDRGLSEGGRRDAVSRLVATPAEEQHSSSVEQQSSTAAMPAAPVACHQQCQQCQSCGAAQQQQQQAEPAEQRSSSASISSSVRGLCVRKPVGCWQQDGWEGCWGLDNCVPALLCMCACAAFGGAALGLDFAPYVTQAATGFLLLAWAGKKTVFQG